ncbi:hypothetical protein KL920_001944 [Ogataea angusta]|nr:hypothetical protein KL920_001944 [Ogataea angusta]
MLRPRLQKWTFLALACAVLFYSTLFLYETRTTGSEVDVLNFSRSALTNYWTSQRIKEQYFKNGMKGPLTAYDIRKMIQDENAKFAEDREILLRKSKDRHVYKAINVRAPMNKVFEKFAKILKLNKMLFPHPERIITLDGKPVIWETQFEETPYNVLSENRLLEFMEFDPQFVEDLTRKHRNVLSSLPKRPVDFYHGSGYTMVGGGMYTWYAYLSIKSLRKTGSKLPIEIVIPQDDQYEPKLCDEIFPNELNATCVRLTQVLGNDTLKSLGELKGYQLKSFAMLASSFENMMYLDSDNFAVSNPDHLFESTLYKKFRMVTWPDFWRRTSSPLLYKILNIKVGNLPVRRLNDFYTPTEKYVTREELIEVEDQINFHDRLGTLPDWTTESGQILINKKEHFNTLLLSLYYNFDGPAGYHPLLSQGGAGEGDKETLVLAAHVLRKPNYQVYRKPDKLYGTFIKHVKFFVDSTIVQFDPVVDYEVLKKAVKNNIQNMDNLQDSYVYSYMHAFGNFAFEEIPGKPLFYHIHNPKMNPFDYVERNLFTDPNDKELRNFGKNFPQIGYDIELWIWELVLETLCERKVEFAGFAGRDMTQICNSSLIADRLEYLRRTGVELLGESQVPQIDVTEDPELDQYIFDKISETQKYKNIK